MGFCLVFDRISTGIVKMSNLESPESKAKKMKMQAYLALVNFCSGIGMVIMGALNNDVDKTDATLFLIVGGSYQMSTAVLKMLVLFGYYKFQWNEKALLVIPLVDLAYFVIIIWGSVAVFGKFKSVMARGRHFM